MSRSSRHRSLSPVPLAAVGVMCAAALFLNVRLTRDLEWPAFDIQFREMAAAQTVLDEGYGPDTCYRGEYVWYNPLSGWLLAATTRVSGVPLRVVVPRLGPLVNLLAPVTFYLLVATLLGAWRGVAATAAYIFVTADKLELHVAASYTAWFTPEAYGQAFFYVALLAAHRAFGGQRSHRWSVALGGLLGLTFLTHTAPALILGGTVVILSVLDVRDRTPFRAVLGRLALVLGSAFLVSLPLSYYVLVKNKLQVVNPFPGLSPWTGLDLWAQPTLARQLLVHSPLAVALLGFGVYLVSRDRRRSARRVLIAWMASVVGLLALNEVRLLAAKAGLVLPSIVPAFHFLYYFMALVSVGVGMAVWQVAAWVSERARPAGLGRWTARLLSPPALAAALTLAMCLAATPFYLVRAGRVATREEALALARTLPGAAYDWIRGHTRNRDVFLCDDYASLYVVNPTGRKVVATNRYFSSPFVDWRARDEDRRRMFEALVRGEREAFAALARRYDVGYVLLFKEENPFMIGGPDLPARAIEGRETALGLALVHEDADVRIFGLVAS